MPQYRYEALDLNGKKVRGQQEAIDEKQLYSNLRGKNLFLIYCEQPSLEVKISKQLNNSTLALFCRELGTMLDSGIDIIRIFDVLVERAETKELKKIYQDILKRLKDGEMLSNALESQRGVFPPLLIHMIRAGEANGQLSSAAMTMHRQFAKEDKVQKKIKTAMIYPSILLVVTAFIVIIIFTVVMPSFSEVFDGMDLPLITKIMMNTSNYIVSRWYIVLTVLFISIIALYLWIRTKAFKHKWAEVKLKLPKISRFLRIIYTARFARTLSSLYVGGVNIISALHLSASTVNNYYLEKQIIEACEKLREGRSLSYAIGEIKGFDYKLVSSISVGEESGKLDVSLKDLADDYDEESMQSIDKLLALMEPVMILLLGVLVCIIVVAVLLPIYSMYSNVK